MEKARLELNEFEANDWISQVCFETNRNRIYIGHDTNISIFDFSTGKRLERLVNLHEDSITAIAFWEDQEYLITGSKDAKSKLIVALTKQ